MLTGSKATHLFLYLKKMATSTESDCVAQGTLKFRAIFLPLLSHVLVTGLCHNTEKCVLNVKVVDFHFFLGPLGSNKSSICLIVDYSSVIHYPCLSLDSFQDVFVSKPKSM